MTPSATAPLLVVLAVVAAVLQVGVLPGAFLEPLASPVLPVALLAGWAATRRPREAWPVPLAAAGVLGALSEARVGVFVLALLPALLVASVLRARERRGEGTAPRRLALAAASGALGALGYVALLAQFEGASSDLLRAAPALVFAAISTALLATMCAAALWRFRTSSGGLFA